MPRPKLPTEHERVSVLLPAQHVVFLKMLAQLWNKQYSDVLRLAVKEFLMKTQQEMKASRSPNNQDTPQ